MGQKKAYAWIILLLLLVVVISGCEQPPKPASQDNGSATNQGNALPPDNGNGTAYRYFKLGIGPIPKDFPGTQEGWADMFEKVPEVGEIVIAQNNWRDSVEKSGKVPEILSVVESQKAKYHYVPQFGINFFDPATGEAMLNTSGNPANDWTNEDAKQKYKSLALKICKEYNAKYLALAIEVNTYYLKHPEDFDGFVAVYKEIYDSVKADCPNTKVFATFQLEEMKGLGDATFGMQIEPHWEIIDMFGGKLDLLAFTTYPEVEFQSPNSIPDNYYSEINEHTSKKIAFTEIGWSNDNGTFLSKFTNLTEDMGVEFVSWVFMHDLPGQGPLTKVGLRNSDGTPKAVWSQWKALKEVPYKER